MGGAMLGKSLIQFSVDGLGCIPSLLFHLRPNYGGGNEDNGDLLQKVPCTHPVLSAPTHASARDSWIKDLLNMAPPFRTRLSFPQSQSLPLGSFYEPLILIPYKADRMKIIVTEN